MQNVSLGGWNLMAIFARKQKIKLFPVFHIF